MKLWPFGKRNAFTVPGPSPWYLKAPEASIRTARGTYTWAFFDGPKSAGISYLVAPDQKPVLVLNFYWYVSPLPNDCILAWREVRSEADKVITDRKVEFFILALNELKPLHDLLHLAENMRAEKRDIAFEGCSPACFSFPTDVGEGSHSMSPPTAFRELPETLVLADYGTEGSNHWDRNFRAIFAFDFAASHVSVIPQRWFNEGSFDFGYQWITRVQREKSGRIVGDGIRLGYFRLDHTGEQIQDWLRQDPFCHPQGRSRRSKQK